MNKKDEISSRRRSVDLPIRTYPFSDNSDVTTYAVAACTDGCLPYYLFEGTAVREESIKQLATISRFFCEHDFFSFLICSALDLRGIGGPMSDIALLLRLLMQISALFNLQHLHPVQPQSSYNENVLMLRLQMLCHRLSIAVTSIRMRKI